TMGKDEGYMWEAQILNAVKQPIVAIGTTMVIVGAEAAVAGGPMAPIGALVAALGAGVMMLGNSIQVNVTTGERITKATDQSLIATGISAVAAFLGGAEIVKGAAAVVSAGASSLAQSSVRYDDEGRSQGLSLASNHGDLRGERAALSATIAMATSATGQYAARNIDGFGALSGAQQALFNDMISTGFQTVSQYGAQQVWGAEHSTYAGMAHADLGRLGSLGYSIFESAYKDSIAREQYEQRQQAEAATMQYALDLAKQANNESQKQQAIQILQGLGYSRKEAEATIAFGSKATVVGSAAYIARELASQLGVKKDGQGLMYAEAEKLLNELKDANGNVSQADMEAVARQMAAKYGGNAEGAFDWSSVAGEVSKTIGEDLKLMAERAAEMKQPAVVPAANQSPRLSPIGRFLNYLSGPTELEASAGGTNSSGGLGGLFDVFMDIQKHVQFGALDALFQIAIEDIQSRDPIHFYNELMKQQGADEYVIISPSEELQKLHDDIFGYLLAPQNDVEKYAQYYGKAQGYVGSFFVGGKAALSKGAVGGEALMTEAGIVAAVNKNADLAVELARRALANGRINGGAQAFGSRAHMYFDRLNRRLASQLERVGSEFSLQSEVFFDRAGTQYLHRVAGTIGPDAVIYNEAGKIIRALDLKTGLTAIQKSRQAEFLRRMGIEVEEIFRHR
ncbi:MAG: hypothetical protein K8S54_21665, partial [Spirochaetia bacterium]|nr:hypothetical protein [Spirochaetia bacterium]